MGWKFNCIPIPPYSMIKHCRSHDCSELNIYHYNMKCCNAKVIFVKIFLWPVGLSLYIYIIILYILVSTCASMRCIRRKLRHSQGLGQLILANYSTFLKSYIQDPLKGKESRYQYNMLLYFMLDKVSHDY